MMGCGKAAKIICMIVLLPNTVLDNNLSIYLSMCVRGFGFFQAVIYGTKEDNSMLVSCPALEIVFLKYMITN